MVTLTKVCLGIILSPHGIKGAVKIKTFTEKSENISLYGELIDDDNRGYTINLLSVVSSNLVIATINGITSRNEAESSRNKKLYIARDKLPMLDNLNEFYHNDIINMEVRLESNELYGHVQSVHNFGSDDILEIQMVNTKKSIMMPFTQEIFPYINMMERYIVLNMPKFID
ncbi:16S rRNA processing protein RimM [Wolbachia pipientis]|uniref:Ribosome maturation factor RimM n=1 Tax=Wolbachia pipientis TaxID=955 RepID=A0A1E7QJP7_WOLPI|nr:ribosome maturation factor RimM [Wolbachia pipientis]OEY86607.1 16S rRNA processing protein RimM [Wolbachia pipientis]